MDDLQKFAEYLRTMGVAPTNQIPFYCDWVARFLKLELRNRDLSDQDKLICWSGHNGMEDWQVNQAEDAVKIYLGWRGSYACKTPPEMNNHQTTLMTAADVLSKTKELIRLRHYSYRTEGTYLSWIERYIRYGQEQKAPLRSHETLKTYLIYLAVKRKVSKATQSQAFNALLFLFREVLNIDVTDMGRVVRAKRGPKIPVVLTDEEVRRLFSVVSRSSLLMLQIIYGKYKKD